MPDIVARLSDVSHRYGKVAALDHISMEIPAGCMVGFIGPDGVGKSSVLALISGSRHIQSGRIEVMGHDMANRHARTLVQPRIAYMPQGLGRNLYPTLSVAENLDFFGRLFDQQRGERERRSTELLQSMGLYAFRDRPVAKLSGGMKQKLGLCCALIHDPDLLILDEPTTGVDPLSRRQFWELIDHIRARHPAMSVVVATAYIEEAERFDWLVAMDEGKVIGNGAPAAFKSRSGSDTLEQAFIALLPEEKRREHHALEIPPWHDQGDGPVIEAEGLTQRFGDFTAVDAVDFSIGKGEIFGFLGSNGCGKTTTMKMLTGLLPPTAGTARLFGQLVDAHNIETRRQVGYMSQAFSLYGELTVRQNLDLHAHLFHLPPARIEGRIAQLLDEFGLEPYADNKSESLPLGIRQRLSLAVALVHEPPLLILDEPTSGVDPIARDAFWALLIRISRQQGVTIFISTHFMNEAERCDRISLMHAGKVLASDNPAALTADRQVENLEQAFISYLEEATGAKQGHEDIPPPQAPSPRQTHHRRPPVFSLGRLFGYAYRETLELLRDKIRLVFALAGSVLLLFMLGYGVTLDVQDLRFAVWDQDHSPESRDYIAAIAGSRYFIERPPIRDQRQLEQRMKSGEISLALEIPPGFGADLHRGRKPEIAAWVDGAMPFRGETIRGYVQAMHWHYVADLLQRHMGVEVSMSPVVVQARYRYNQDVRSLDAMVPAMIPLLLVFIPSILMSLAVVREKELGSITNLYVTPVTRLEFLLGKQLPYVVVSMFSMLALVAAAIFVFGVPLKGSPIALAIAGLIYVIVTTGMGLVVSAFTRTQIAALAATAILAVLPSVQFSGLTSPTTSLEGIGHWIGTFWPVTYFLTISRGLFSKAVAIHDLRFQFLALAAFIPVLLTASLLLLKKQED